MSFFVLAQHDAQRSNNFFPCGGLVEVPNFKGPLRDQRLYIIFLSDRLIKRLLEGHDVTPLFDDQEDLLPPGSSDKEDLRSWILGVDFGRREPRKLPLIFRVLHRGHRNLSFLLLIKFFFPFSSFPSASIPHPSVGSGLWWPQRKWTMCFPSLSWESDPQGEKAQPSSPPLAAFLGYVYETLLNIFQLSFVLIKFVLLLRADFLPLDFLLWCAHIRLDSIVASSFFRIPVRRLETNRI